LNSRENGCVAAGVQLFRVSLPRSQNYFMQRHKMQRKISAAELVSVTVALRAGLRPSVMYREKET